MAIAWSCISNFSFQGYIQPSWTSFATRNAYQGNLPTSLNQPNSALQKPADLSPYFSDNGKLILWSRSPRQPWANVSHQPSSLHHQHLQWGSSSGYLTHQLNQKGLLHTPQEPPWLFALCCALFPADTFWVGVPHEHQETSPSSSQNIPPASSSSLGGLYRLWYLI